MVPKGRLLAVHGVDVALRQRLLHEWAALTLRARDVFNARCQCTQLAVEGLIADFQTKYETRVGYLGFTWFLGGKKPAPGDSGGFGA